MACDDGEIADLGDALAKVKLDPPVTICLPFSPLRKAGYPNEKHIAELSVSEADDTNDTDDEGGVALVDQSAPSATTSLDGVSYERCGLRKDERPVVVSFNEPNNALCFGAQFIQCSFPGLAPLSFHNYILRNVVFVDCHFEDTRFSNCVMEDMKVVSCIYADSCWFNRVLTTEFITIGKPQDGTLLFDGQRNGMGDGSPEEWPEKLKTSDYKDSLQESTTAFGEDCRGNLMRIRSVPRGDQHVGGPKGKRAHVEIRKEIGQH